MAGKKNAPLKAGQGQGEGQGQETNPMLNIPADNCAVNADPSSVLQRIVDDCGGHFLDDGSAMSRCPAHDDRNPSLHITQNGDQLLVYCHAGCGQEAVIQALRDRGLWPTSGNEKKHISPNLPPGIPSRWKDAPYVYHWTYCNFQAEILGYVVRYEGENGKQVVPFFKVNGRKWKAGAAQQPRPLYGQHKLAKTQPKTQVLFVEGEKAADAAQRLVGHEYVVMTWPGGTNVVHKVDYTPLKGRDVVIWPDADEAGRKAAQQVAEQLRKAGAALVSIVELPQDVAKGWDLADAEQSGWTGESVISWIQDNSSKQEQKDEQEDEGCENSNNRKPTQSELLIQIANSQGAKFYEAEGFDTIYAAFPVAEHHENWPVRSKPFKRWLSGYFYASQGKPPGNQALHDAFNILEAKAQFEATPRTVYTRLAAHQNAIYLDLCDQSWRAIEITAKGWRIVSNPPVSFRRAPGMLPLPVPVRGGSLLDLGYLLNMSNNQLILAISWLVGAMNPHGPFPIFLLEGEQGTAKSNATRIIRCVIDPSSAPIRTYPREDEDLMIAAQNGWVLAYDNLSGIPTWLSDSLCRLATGGGYSTRERYTVDDEVIFSATRPIIFNSINRVAHRHDILDRCITVQLEPIPQTNRLLERDLWNTFERVHPQILGGLCDAVATALSNKDELKLESLPRMADFAHWIVSAEPSLPWEQGEFMLNYNEVREHAIRWAIESDTVASTIFKLMESKEIWSGTSTELLQSLKMLDPEIVNSSTQWPKDGSSLKKRINRIKAFLREGGIEVFDDFREPGTGKRLMQLKKSQNQRVTE